MTIKTYKAVTVREIQERHYLPAYFRVRVYESRARKRDGLLTWRLLEDVTGLPQGYHNWLEADEKAEEYAREHGLSFIEDIKQNCEVVLSDLQRLADAVSQETS